MRAAYFSLGSNRGDSAALLLAAIEGLRSRGVEVNAVSDGYATEPVGEVLDQPDFLNAAARAVTGLEPLELLEICKQVELEHGRDPDAPRHSPRPLDIDLLLVGELWLETERLTIPHPALRERRFVLEPLLEIEPGLRLPDGSRAEEALEALGEGQRVERLGPLEALVG